MTESRRRRALGLVLTSVLTAIVVLPAAIHAAITHDASMIATTATERMRGVRPPRAAPDVLARERLSTAQATDDLLRRATESVLSHASQGVSSGAGSRPTSVERETAVEHAEAVASYAMEPDSVRGLSSASARYAAARLVLALAVEEGPSRCLQLMAAAIRASLMGAGLDLSDRAIAAATAQSAVLSVGACLRGADDDDYASGLAAFTALDEHGAPIAGALALTQYRVAERSARLALSSERSPAGLAFAFENMRAARALLRRGECLAEASGPASACLTPYEVSWVGSLFSVRPRDTDVVFVQAHEAARARLRADVRIVRVLLALLMEHGESFRCDAASGILLDERFSDPACGVPYVCVEGSISRLESSCRELAVPVAWPD